MALTLVAPALADQATANAPGPSSGVAAHVHGATAVYADTDHVTVITPTVALDAASPSGWDVEADYLADIVSAASVDIVSTASSRWHETRHAGSLDVGYRPGTFALRAKAALSREPDYESTLGGGSLSWDFARRSHTAFTGVTVSQDTMGRTGVPFSTFSRTLNGQTISAGVTLTLNRSSLLTLTNDLGLERGDQSKPYRYVPLFSEATAPSIERGASVETVQRRRLPARPLESLPGSRRRYAITARLGHRLRDATLRLDERGYADSWGLHASTTSARFFLDLSRRLVAWTEMRFHAQSSAYFFRTAYVGRLLGDGLWQAPRFRTGDRELSRLVTVGLGAGGRLGLGSAAHPSAIAVVAQGHASHTEFYEALYVSSRNALLATLGVEAGFE